MSLLIEKICSAFAKARIPYAVVGGYAVALHGATRGTIDLDLITEQTLEAYEKIERIFKDLGFLPRLPLVAKEVFQFREEYIKKRNLVAWSFYNKINEAEIVDVIITHDLRKFRTVKKEFRGTKVVVLALDDLIIMKQDSNRPQDLADIAMLKGLKK
jgi:hypothetical protein